MIRSADPESQAPTRKPQAGTRPYRARSMSLALNPQTALAPPSQAMSELNSFAVPR